MGTKEQRNVLLKTLPRLHLPDVNPIIVKELRSRMRGARAFIILTVVLLLLAGFSYLVYRLTLAMAPTMGTPVSPQIGQTLFNTLAFIELMIICLITPAVTAGAISSEREKLTYEMLLSTPLRPASILWGKLVSALSYIFLLIFAAVPLASLVFTFGGVSLRDMAKALMILVATAITLGVMGVFLSAWLGRTARATVANYLVVLSLFILPVVAYVAAAVLSAKEPPRQLLMPSPAGALFSATSTSMPYMGAFTVFGDLSRLVGGNMDIIWGAGRGIPRPLYHYTLPFYVGLTLVLYLLATRLVLPTQRWRLKLKDILLAVVLIGMYSGVVYYFFSATYPRYEGASTPSDVQTPIMGGGGGGGGGFVGPTGPFQFVPTTPVEDVAVIQKRLLEDENELGSVYAAAAFQIYSGVADSNEFTQLFLVETTDNTLDDNQEGIPLQKLPTESVVSNFQGLVNTSLKLSWIKTPADAPISPQTRLLEKGFAVLQFGVPLLRDDGQILLSTEIQYVDEQNVGLDKLVKTYTLNQATGVWKVVEQTE